MAKDRTESEIREKKEKKEKKDKKRKSSEAFDAGADGEDVTTKKEKKSKKERKSVTTAELTAVEQEQPGIVAVDGEGDVSMVKADDEGESKAIVKVEVPAAALVPFANPLCDEKAQKKVLKAVKKAAKNKALKRGVKECVKSVRKSPTSAPSAINNPAVTPPGIVVLAADISPMDVIAHIPVLCEDHNIPYVYVPSRAELGAAGSTKRPTSVVMLTPKVGKNAPEADDSGRKEWDEVYRDLHKLAIKLGQHVKV